MEHTPPPESKPLPPPVPPAQQPEQPCPRCNSTNTKFCYYNNYSLSQPRYFCKSCRRYWTKGGTLRNVPVGGGCRRKPKSSSRRSDTQFSAVSDTPSPNFTSLVSFDDLGFHFSGGPQKLADVEFPVLENSGRFQNNGVGAGAGGSQVAGFLDSLRFGSFFDGSSSFGYGSYVGNTGEGGGGGGAAGGFAAEMEFSNLEREGRVLWGFPWQVNSDHGVGSGSGRGSWAELNPAAWHGLLNNTLL